MQRYNLFFSFLFLVSANIFAVQDDHFQASLINQLDMVGPHPHYIERLLLLLEKGIIPTNRLFLFHGPSGTGKTRCAEEIARVAGGNVIKVSGYDLIDRYIGSGAENIRDVFKQAQIGGRLCPDFDKNKMTVLIIDHVDAIMDKKGESLEHIQTTAAIKKELDKLKKSEHVAVVIMIARDRNNVSPVVLDRVIQEKF